MKKELAKTYSPKDFEDRLYHEWEEKKYFHAEIDPKKKPYTIVIPPPNITGQLHMGHALDNTLQDILIRYKRMQGYSALWLPGTDHASIATEAKIVNAMKEEGLTKDDVGRDGFLERAWEWKKVYGGRIVQQLKKLGSSCDWDRERFTLDEGCSKAVQKVFIDLYNKGLIYHGERIINWCPNCKTSISDIECEYEEQDSFFWHINYPLSDGSGSVEIATTRPETLLGDSALAVNPDDERYKSIVGKTVKLPLTDREIPVIADEYVDIEFGTGCLKVTPAHDVNDYMLGEKYHLPSIDIFNDNGTISKQAGIYVGMDRFDVREQIEKDLQAAGLLEKVEPYTNNVGFSERTNVPIEPKLSMQWFLKMEHLAEIALSPVMNDDIRFFPSKFKNTYRHWMENIKDWCISRQLWWGHRIPAWYLPEGGYVVAYNEEEALRLAREKSHNSNLTIADLRQDEDCLDTWFSSWLWPISLFDGINHPGNPEINYYYPTNDLVTGPDIIFFWVARMIMAGYEYEGKMPFKNVYFTGIVRDKLGRKMSKSLGNSPDPLDLIDKYGADGVRVGMLLCAPAGGDLLFDESLPEQGRNFTTKMWNAFKLVKSWEVASIDQPAHSRLALEWFNHLLGKVNETLNTQFDQYRISEALMTVYTTFRDEFSSWLLEMIKPAYGQPIDRKTYEETLNVFEQLLQLLHPFMPFITEEIWQTLRERQDGESIMISRLPKATSYDESYLLRFEAVKNIIVGIRNIRKQNNIAFKNVLELKVKKNERYPASFDSIIRKMGNIGQIGLVNEPVKGAWSFIADTVEYFIPAQGEVNTAEVKAKLEEELNYTRGFLTSVMKKLSNEKFVNGAPEQIVANERKKQADAEVKIAAIEAQLKRL